MNTGRREFLKTVTCLGVGGSVIDLSAGRAAASHADAASDEAMGVLVDLTKCNGCRQCESACKEAAGFDPPTREELLDESVYAGHRPLTPQSYSTIPPPLSAPLV